MPTREWLREETWFDTAACASCLGYCHHMII
jgi:hypothetical protein